MNTLPFFFSFHDQIICLLYLLNGKFIRLKRFLYLYDVGPWERWRNRAEARRRLLQDAPVWIPCINMLHWFLCGFEGAVLIRNADIFPDYPLAQRQVIADLLVLVDVRRASKAAAPHLRFAIRGRSRKPFARNCRRSSRPADVSGHAGRHQRLHCRCFRSSKAQRYFEFWNAVINKRKPGHAYWRRRG